jgi:cytochrome c oxidase cbb3-type subunit 3
MKRLLKLLTVAVSFTLTAFPLAAAQEEAPPYPATQAAQGEARFAAACGFCHGRDAAGGSRGLDLVRSELVANDVNGNLIGDVVRSGRPNTDMTAFSPAVLSAGDLDAIVAFIHNQRYLFATLEGGRRSVLPEDVAIGDAAAGNVYFDTHCTACHDAARDLAGIGGRMQGLQLMMRMLYPASDRRGPSPAPSTVTVTLPTGQQITGPLEYQDEFTLALRLPGGEYRSFLTREVDFAIDDPLQAHVDQLEIYTDADMHNVLAYLLSLQ